MLLSQAAEGSWMQLAVTCLVTNLHLVRFWHLATLVDAMVEITRHGLFDTKLASQPYFQDLTGLFGHINHSI